MLPFYENNSWQFRCFRFVPDEFPSHLHKELEIVYVRQGAIEIRQEDLCFCLEERDCAVIFPNTVHSYRQMPGSDVLMTVFDQSLVSHPFGNLRTCRSQKPFIKAAQVHPDIPYCMEKLLQLGAGQEHPAAVIGYHILMLGHVLESVPITDTPSCMAETNIQKILSYSSAHFREPITISSIGKALGLNRCYVSRLFNQKVGSSFPDYLNALRMDLAAQLLLTTDDTVESIALSCGFSGDRSFYRNFRKIYHTTPRKYRGAGFLRKS